MAFNNQECSIICSEGRTESGIEIEPLSIGQTQSEENNKNQKSEDMITIKINNEIDLLKCDLFQRMFLLKLLESFLEQTRTILNQRLEAGYQKYNVDVFLGSVQSQVFQMFLKMQKKEVFEEKVRKFKVKRNNEIVTTNRFYYSWIGELPWFNNNNWYWKEFTFNGRKIRIFYSKITLILFEDGRLKAKCWQVCQTEIFPNIWIKTI